MPEFDRLEIEHFFAVYKDLEPGKSVEGATWAGRVEAEAEIHASYARLGEHEAAPPRRPTAASGDTPVAVTGYGRAKPMRPSE